MVANGTAPRLVKRSITSFCASIWLTSVLIFLTVAAGVPAGARMPNHGFTSKPEKPDSATVGTSFNASERLALVTAIARTEPARTCCTTEGMLA